MDKKFIARFDSAHGPTMMQEVVEYRTHRDGRRIVEFLATSGKRFIAYLEDIKIQEAVKVPVAHL